MSKAGRSGDITRAPRNNNVPKEDDEQTQLELELASSGRKDAFPREGLVGAHHARRAPAFSDSEAEAEGEGESEEGQEPTGPGSDVAPTKRAEARERERHRIEREIGHTPAGEGGLVRGRNAPGLGREDLEEAARQADRRVVGHDIGKKRR